MNTEKNENSIFRAEALQHKREGWFGPPRLHIPSSLSTCLITGFITCFFIVLIISLGSYNERVNVIGTVVYNPPAVSIIAQNNGIIINSSALEGAAFKRGEPIFSVNSDIQTAFGATNFEIVELFKKQRKSLYKKIDIAFGESKKNSNYLIKRIKNKEQEIENLEKLIKESEKQKNWFEKKSKLYKDLKKRGSCQIPI